MRRNWRLMITMILACLWPQLGCHQLPANKSIQEGPPPIQKNQQGAKQQLTAEDVGQSLVEQARGLETKKPGEAVAMYEKIRTSDPGNAAHATKRIAFLYMCSNEFDRAQQEYEGLLHRNPRDVDVLFALGDIASRHGRFAIAEKYFRETVRIRPDHPQAQVNLAVTLAHTGDHAGSLDWFKKAGFDESESHCQIGSILRINGKREEAMAAFEQALKCDPRCGRAKLEMEQLYRQDPDLPVRVPAPTNTGKLGHVNLESAPQPLTTEGLSRTLMQRPTMLPLPEIDIPTPDVGDWPTTGTKR